MTTTHGSELVQTAKLISHGSVFFAALARVSRVRKRQKQRPLYIVWRTAVTRSDQQHSTVLTA
jgi:hypothetical protein